MTSHPPIENCWFLVGPTAAGKSAVGLELAQRLGAEIISLDSMAVYRGMDIGTAKPAAAARQAVPHHLVDLVEPTEEFSIAQYVELAHGAAAEIRGRGNDVLFIGGTPLYLKALLCGISHGPKADWSLRGELMAEARDEGSAALHARLSGIDPAAAARVHPHDTRRLIRALEVYQRTGQPISDTQDHFHREHVSAGCRVFVLDWPRPELHRRINARVLEMFAAGLVHEVRSLLERHGQLGRTAAQAVGYREVIEHLTGRMELAAAVERTQARTRQFARRQLIWFRKLRDCRFLPVCEPLRPEWIAAEIIAAAKE